MSSSDHTEPERLFVCPAAGLAWLAAKDQKLGAFIEATGPLGRRIYPDPFTGLCRAIIGQQISGKALNSIWARYRAAFAPLTPEQILSQPLEALRACGISQRKAEYLRGIAAAFASGAISANALAQMDDESLIEALGALRGVGRWTAEMLLIFTFQRQNVLSFADLGIRTGMCQLYGYDSLDRERFLAHRENYAPYGTIAAFYLWEAAAQKKAALRQPRSGISSSD